MPSKPTSKLFPILCLLLAATFWGVLWFPLRLLEEGGLSGLWMTLIIYGSALVVGLPIMWRSLIALSNRYWWTLLFALANGWCNIAFIVAVLDGNVVRVILLFYLMPLWAVLLAWLILGERLSRYALATLVVAMMGALTMLWEPHLGMPWPKDYVDWLAITSGFAFALSNVLARQAQDIPVKAKTLVAWVGVTTMAGMGILAAAAPIPELEWDVLGGAFILGTLGIGGMSLAVLYGVTHMPVHRSAILLLSELVAGVVSAQLLTDETVLPKEWLGGALIVLAAWLSARRQISSQ